MSYYGLFSHYDGKSGDRLSDAFDSRDEIVKKISGSHTDILVVGGGIYGASAAWIAALQGFSVVLLEPEDYGCDPMNTYPQALFSEFRWQEFGSYGYIKEELLAREELFHSAPHLAYPHDCVVVDPTKSLLKRKFSHFVFDQLSPHLRRHHRTPEGYAYSDGIFDYPQIIRETVIAARQEGARALNHASIVLCSHRKDNRVVVAWHDTILNERHELTAGAVLNCMGVNAATMGRVTPAEFSSSVGFARAVQLVFSAPLDGPAQLYPDTSNKLFITRHPCGTVVGSGESLVNAAEVKKEPTTEEIQWMLSKLHTVAPHLNKSTFVYAFAGQRTIVLGKEGSPGCYQWVINGGVLSLLGGCPSLARVIAREGVKQVIEISGAPVRFASQALRLLPGAAPKREEYIKNFLAVCNEKKVPDPIAQGAVARLGAFVRFLLEDDSYLEVFENVLLVGELVFAHKIGQAFTHEDLIRRFQIECMSPRNASLADALATYLMASGESSQIVRHPQGA